MKSLNRDVKKNLKQMFIGIFILGILLIIIFLCFGRLDRSAVIGTTIGCSIAFLNYFLLAFTIQKTLDAKTKGKAIAGFSYTGRFFLQIILSILSIVLLKVNPVSVLVPLLFPRLVILGLQISKKAVPTEGEQDGRPN